MKEPTPLLREGATDFERRLLSAALEERPSPRLQAQMRRGIGLTGPLLWAGNVKAMLGTLLGKSVIGAVALVAAGGFAVVAHTRAEGPSVPVKEQQVQAAAAPALAPVAGEPTRTDVTARAEGVGRAGAGDDGATAVDATANENAASSGQLREEIRLLDQARGALQRGSAKDARSVLDEYRERFPTGILGREANVLLEQTRAHGMSHTPVKERPTPAPHRAH